MVLTADSFWLRIAPLRPISLIPDDLNDFMHELCGEIVYDPLGDDKDPIAGRFRIYYVNFKLAEQCAINPFEILDLEHHTNEYAHVILDSNKAPFSSRLEKLLGDEIWDFNLLILDRIEILPAYRGHGIGLLTLISLIQRFGEGAGVVGIKPFPLQFEPKQNRSSSEWAKSLRLEELTSERKKAKEKLKLYYGKLGFVEMKSTPFMFFNTAWALPSVEQLRAQKLID